MTDTTSKNQYALHLARYSTYQQIVNLLPTGSNVLDIGCNDGYIGRSAGMPDGFYGVDYSAESVKQAKKIYADAVVMDLNKLAELPWNKQFDVIIFADVLEHLLFPAEILAYFCDNYLKKDGFVVISVPNIANWKIRLSLLFGKFNYTDTGILDRTHLHFYTYKSVAELLSECSLIKVRQYGGASFLGVIMRLIPFTKGLFATSIIVTAKRK